MIARGAEEFAASPKTVRLIARPGGMDIAGAGGHSLLLLDADHRRRAEICFGLAEAGVRVQPFETMGEMVRFVREGTPLLVRDEGDTLADLVSRLSEDCRRAPIIAFADRIDVARILWAGRLGVADYLIGKVAAQDIVERLVRLAGREPGKISAEKRREKARHLINELSAREREILLCVANGLRSAEIGEALSISRRTVERHRANILDKLGVRRTSEALRVVFDSSLHDEFE